jgi:inhibitor of cysteine peptidase
MGIIANRLATATFLGLIVAVCGPVQGDTPRPLKEVKVTEKENGGTVSLVPGQELVVSLAVTTGTGYTWQTAAAPKGALKQVGEPKVERPNPSRPGAPARQVFRFVAEAAGEGKLDLQYRRPFEKNAKPARTFTLKVVVAPPKVK